MRLGEGKELAHSHREQLTELALEFGSLSLQISLPWLLGLYWPLGLREKWLRKGSPLPGTCGSGGAEKGSQQEEAGLDSLLPVLFLTSSVKYSGPSGSPSEVLSWALGFGHLGWMGSDAFKAGSGHRALASVTTVGEDLVVGGRQLASGPLRAARPPAHRRGPAEGLYPHPCAFAL